MRPQGVHEQNDILRCKVAGDALFVIRQPAQTIVQKDDGRGGIFTGRAKELTAESDGSATSISPLFGQPQRAPGNNLFAPK